jgi:hypothetical protein
MLIRAWTSRYLVARLARAKNGNGQKMSHAAVVMNKSRKTTLDFPAFHVWLLLF